MVQRTNIKKGKDKFRGENSPYWDWISQHSTSDGAVSQEPAIANPDWEAEHQAADGDIVAEKYALAIAAFSTLSKQELTAIDCLWKQRMTFREGAEWCRMSLGKFQRTVEGAREKIKQHMIQKAD